MTAGQDPERPAESTSAGAAPLEDLLAELRHLTDGDIMALAGFRAGEDAAALASARGRAEAAVTGAGRDAALAKARDTIARWAEKVGGGEVSGFLGGTDGLRRLDQRMDAVPAVLDAALAYIGTGIVGEVDVAVLTAAWEELEAGDGEADLDAIAEQAAADPDDPSGARL